MATLNFDLQNEKSGVQVEHEFDTKAENLHMLYHIVRNSLYSDEPMALIREYSTNAADAHVASGQPDRPILVALPTVFEPYLKIRDFGPGLSGDDIRNFVSFGESSKRGDDTQTGQLGIGCKCGFTYGDSFIVNSYQGGKLTSWNAYIDPSNKGKIALMAESETTEGDGLEIVVPIQSADINKFHEKAMLFFSFWRVVPQFVNDTVGDKAVIEALRTKKALFSGTDWKYFGMGESYVTMGNIAYPIKGDVFSEHEISPEVRRLLAGGIYINCSIGSLDFAASREQLKYTPATKAELSRKINEIAVQLVQDYKLQFDSCKTLWEAKLLFKNVLGNQVFIRDLFKSSYLFKGRKVDSGPFQTLLPNIPKEGIVCQHYFTGYAPKYVDHSEHKPLPCREDILIVENDLRSKRGISNHIVKFLKDGTNRELYVITFETDEIKKQWLEAYGFDGPMTLISTLSKEPLSKYFPNAASGIGTANSKHQSQEFTYQGDGQYRSRYCAKSEFWQIAEVDLEEDSGVYVRLDKFFYYRGGMLCHPSSLAALLGMIRDCGIHVPLVYGFKASSMETVSKNKNMVDLFTWISKALAEYCHQNPSFIEQKTNNTFYRTGVVKVCPNAFEVSKYLVDLTFVKTQASHPLKDVFTKLQALHSWDQTKLGKFDKLAENVDFVFPKASYDASVVDDIIGVKTRYPLLFALVTDTGCLGIHKHAAALSSYVELVDCVTPQIAPAIPLTNDQTPA